MFSAIGKLLKIVIILIAIIIGIAFFTGAEVSFSDEKTSSAIPASESSEVCKVGYYKNSSKSDCLKVPDNAFSASGNWYCKSGYKKSGEGCIKQANESSNSSTRIQIPENAYATALVSRGWKCTSDYEVSGNSCIRTSKNINDSSKQENESSSKSTNTKVKVDSKPDRWWEKTKKYQICYGNVTAAHKANGLHTRNRDKSIEIKEQLCKIAATSTTGEGSFWLK
jgi:hypothetical protein